MSPWPWSFRRSRLCVTPSRSQPYLGHGEWRTLCACGGWSTGLPWVVDFQRRA